MSVQELSRSILIIGAGYVGKKTARLAVDGGFSQVFIGRRHPEPLVGTTAIALDVTDPQTLAELPPVNTIVYAVSADHHSQEAYDLTYRQGVENLLKAIRPRKDKPHVIYISSTSVYAEESGGWVTEDTSDLVTTGPSTAIVAGEDILKTSGFPYTILRFGGIYGPERLYFLNRVRSGMDMLYDGPPIYSNRIHRDDGARAILHAAEHTVCRNRTFNVVDEAPEDRNTVVRWLHQSLGVSTPLASTKDRAMLAVRGNKRCSSAALKQTGFDWIYRTYQEGYAPLMQR